MPGIVGLQTRMPRGWAEPQLKRMVEVLLHEPFYGAGTWIDESMGIYVGWIARKGSFSETGLLQGDQTKQTLIFSGEDFSEAGTACCRDDCAPFYLARLAETDLNFPATLNGRFHGLAIDQLRGTATLFNDRYGLHRVYYHQAREGFYFSAEAKAILAVRPELRRMEPRALGEYVTCGCVLENRTLFEGIRVLPGASKWLLKNGSAERKDTYFDPREWEEQEVLEPEKYYRQLRDVFTRQLPIYFESKEQIGMSLTGGLDSRMILAWQNPPPGSLPCYTFGGIYRDCQDVIVARQVARTCQQPHQVLEVGDAFLSQFQNYAERTVYLTDGCADVRRASDLYLNEQAREIAPVRMTGNYGSEVLRGGRAFKPTSPMPGLFQEDMLPFLRQAEITYQSIVSAHPVSFAVFRQAPWHHYGLLALEETKVSLRSPYLDNKTSFEQFTVLPRSTFASPTLSLRLIEDGDPMLRRIPSDRGLGQTGLFGLVMNQVEEFLVKAEYSYDYGMPQWLARADHILAPLHIERLFLGRHKFNHYRVWYRDTLGDYVSQILLDPQTLSRPYLQKSQLEKMVRSHLTGNQNFTIELHLMLALELIQRLLIHQK